MPNVEEIAEMKADERRDALTALAANWYGSKSGWRSRFNRETGLGNGTVAQWFSDRSLPPVWSILLVQAWIDARDIAAPYIAEKDANALIIENVKRALDMQTIEPEPTVLTGADLIID